MNRTITLPVSSWPELTQTLTARISDAQFEQAGVWQLQHVRLDLPLALVQGPRAAQTPWAALCHWLTRQNLPFQIAGARRDDIALQLEFARFL